jgi:hypothetical protein
MTATANANDDAPKPATAARIYDYFLGGTHNFPADREAAQALIATTSLSIQDRPGPAHPVRLLTWGLGRRIRERTVLTEDVAPAGRQPTSTEPTTGVAIDVPPVAVVAARSSRTTRLRCC